MRRASPPWDGSPSPPPRWPELKRRASLLLFAVLALVPAAAQASTRAERRAKKYGIAAPLVSTCPATVDVPAPVCSTTPVTVASPPPLDSFQRTVSDAFVSPIAWFDSLFFTERDEVETNDSYLRFIVGPAWVNGEGIKIRRAIRLKVRVPRLQERLHLIFSDEDEREADATSPDRGGALEERGIPFSPTRTNGTPDNRSRSRAGLGYQILKAIDTDVDVETALRSHARGELDVRARQKLPRWYGVQTKLIVTGFWLQGTGFGSIGRVDNERPLNDRTLLHFDNAVTQIHAQNGVVEDSRLSAEIRISQSTGLSPSVGFRGETRPRWRASLWYSSIVMRRQFFRDWLFYEIEPGENWDRLNHFHPQPFVALRLEAQFRRPQKN